MKAMNMTIKRSDLCVFCYMKDHIVSFCCNALYMYYKSIIVHNEFFCEASSKSLVS